MNVIDLFCGSGGLSYGFEQAGYNVLLGVDNDAKALETFKYNHKNSETLCCDIRDINSEDILKIIGKKRIDVIVGGPPCQGMSLSGPRKFDDPRNDLYLSFLRLIEQIKPKAVIIENVPGLVSLFNGAIKDIIIKRMMKMGYNVTHDLLIASDYGVPQNRKRVFFVGILDSEMIYKFPHKDRAVITTEMAISDLKPLINELGTNDESEYYTKIQNQYQKKMRAKTTAVKNHIAANHSDRIKKIISMVPDGGNYKDLPKEYISTRKFNVAWTRFSSKKPSPTIDTGHRHHFHYKYNRVPTVRECARLQSFPDNFVFSGSKTQQFRQVGNAVPPILAEKLAERLKDYIIRG
jgi:DNA (cytosine-5)-methyltransferase 1